MTASLAFALVSAACTGNGNDGAALPEPFDACTLITAEDARGLLGDGSNQEQFESGIGPGCVYRADETRVGLNLRAGSLTSDEWVNDVVQPTVSSLPAEEEARLMSVNGVGEAAHWVIANKSHVLLVFDAGRTFDLFVELGPKPTDKRLLKIAKALAKRVLKRLPAPNAPPFVATPTG